MNFSILKMGLTSSRSRLHMVLALSLVRTITFLEATQGADCIGAGEEWTDTVNLGSGLVITKQSIGVASTSTGFSGVDGILG